MKRINILAVSNGVGITRDVGIIKRVLESDGYDVECNHTFKFKPKHRYDLNIHLERFNPNAFQIADLNVMIPNQEWFELPWLPDVKSFDCFFTKTYFAEKIFSALNNTKFIGFTSEDCYLPVTKDPFHWVHVAGKSIQKQTEVVIRTWEKNPGFPIITIIQDPKFWRPRTTLPNVNFMIDRVPEEILKTIQNVSQVHVCPSYTEGFGHYIMEAMSVGSIVIATDGPPMNELVKEDRGVLIRHVREEPMNLSTKFVIDEKTLEEAVIKTMVMDEGKKTDMGLAARAFYEKNNAAFELNLKLAVRSLF